MKDLLATADVFRLVFDEARDFAVFVLDAEGRIEVWNPGAERIFGYSVEEVTGRYFDFLFTPVDRENGAPDRELLTARETGRADDTRWHSRKGGTQFFADGVTTAIRADDGSIAGFSKITRDITDRYRTEQRLAAQLALTNLLNEDQPIETTAQRVMQTICELLGWDVGALWEIGGETLRCADLWFSPEIETEAVRALCDGRQLREGEGLPGEVWANRTAVWIANFRDSRFPRAAVAERAGLTSAFAFPITADGRVIGVLEFFSRAAREPEQALLPVMTLIGAQIGDYIARRRTLRALRESEERYRLVSETAQDAIFTITPDSTIQFCNSAVERLFGWEPRELIGRNLDVIIPERLREAHRRGISRFLATRQKHIPWTGVELPALRKDGTEFPCEISFGAWTEGEQTLFTGFARDITERQKAREELQLVIEHEQRAREQAEAARMQLQRRADEEASFRHLASALTGAVEMTDVLHEITQRATLVTRADGVYVERIVEVSGQKMVEVVTTAGRGAPPRGLRVSFPGSMSDEIVQGRQPVILADMHKFGKNMAPYLLDTCSDCQVLVTPLVAENEPLGALVLLNGRASGRTFRETDIVRARTLGDMTSLALRRVRLMEQEREAKEKAEAAVRVRDETLGIVSHDLRNPLTKIALSANLLRDAPVEEHQELIETIGVAARQMERLIQDLLDVARVEAGRLSVDRKTMETEPLVQHVCASNGAIAQQKGQTIVCNVASPLPPICADRDRLLQVFGNLIGNAMKFTPERGTITLEAEPVGDAVRFRVRDTGPGIPEADLKNVFRPYWQAKKTAHMGAGLGLAIVRGIIEAHGGSVWAENAPGGGAMFTFTVPVG